MQGQRNVQISYFVKHFNEKKESEFAVEGKAKDKKNDEKEKICLKKRSAN